MSKKSSPNQSPSRPPLAILDINSYPDHATAVAAQKRFAQKPHSISALQESTSRVGASTSINQLPSPAKSSAAAIPKSGSHRVNMNGLSSSSPTFALGPPPQHPDFNFLFDCHFAETPIFKQLPKARKNDAIGICRTMDAGVSMAWFSKGDLIGYESLSDHELSFSGERILLVSSHSNDSWTWKVNKLSEIDMARLKRFRTAVDPHIPHVNDHSFTPKEFPKSLPHLSQLKDKLRPRPATNTNKAASTTPKRLAAPLAGSMRAQQQVTQARNSSSPTSAANRITNGHSSKSVASMGDGMEDIDDFDFGSRGIPSAAAAAMNAVHQSQRVSNEYARSTQAAKTQAELDRQDILSGKNLTNSSSIYRSTNYRPGFGGKGYTQTSLMNWSKSSPRPSIFGSYHSNLTSYRNMTRTGFKNVGNSCYINAVLQSLLGLPTFLAALSDDHLTGQKNECQRPLPSDSVYITLFNMGMERILTAAQGLPVDTAQMKAVLGKRNRTFSGYAQQDAHEFFSECLNFIHEDVEKALLTNEELQLKLKKEERTPTPENEEMKTEEMEVEDSATMSQERQTEFLSQLHRLSPVYRNFQCELETIMTCTKCQHQRTLYEPFHDFSIDLPEKPFRPISSWFSPKSSVTSSSASTSTSTIRAPLASSPSPLPSSTSTSFSADVFGAEEKKSEEKKGPLKLTDLIQSFFKPREMEYRCQCKEGDLVHATTTLSQIPRILVLHLKRFQFEESSKRMQKRGDIVTCPSTLDITHLVAAHVRTPAPMELTQPAAVAPATNNGKNLLTAFEAASPSKSPTTVPASAAAAASSSPSTANGHSSGSKRKATVDLPSSSRVLKVAKTETSPVPKKELTEDEQMELALKESEQMAKQLAEQEDKELQMAIDASKEASLPKSVHHTYRLASVILHKGEFVSSGHYVSQILQKDEKGVEQWKEYDDAYVTKLSDIEAKKAAEKEGYILFYSYQPS